MHRLGKLAVFIPVAAILPNAILLTSVALWPQAQSSASPSTDEKPAAQTPAAPPDSTRLEVLKSSRAPYPLKAMQEGIQGRVVVKVTISQQGDVIGADVVSGDPVLAESAVNTVKKWKFKPYIRNGKAVQAVTQLPFDFSFTDKTEDVKPRRDAKAASGAPPQNQQTKDQQTADVGKQAAAGATSNTGAAETGTASSSDSAAASSTAAFGGASSSGTSSSGAPSENQGENKAASSTVEKDSSAATGRDFPKRAGVMGGVVDGNLLHKVIPVYPPEAKRNRIQGTVKLHALIDEQGRVAELSPISGPKELVPAAMGAVELWRYRPYILNGQPVAVETTITVNFNLR